MVPGFGCVSWINKLWKISLSWSMSHMQINIKIDYALITEQYREAFSILGDVLTNSLER